MDNIKDPENTIIMEVKETQWEIEATSVNHGYRKEAFIHNK